MPEENVLGRGFTEGELKAANWWIRNKITIRTWTRIILLSLNAIVWLYVLWGLLDGFVISYPRESAITTAIAVNQQNLDRFAADRPLGVGTSAVLVFPTTENRVDISVDLQNTNKDWWAEFTYKFNIMGEQTPARQGFILPDELTTLTELGFKTQTPSARSAQLIIDNIRWHRIEPSQVEHDYTKFIEKRFGDVRVQNVRFEASSVAAGRPASRTTFEIVNQSAFGYWSIDYVIKLMRGSTMVAINKINIRELKPGETRTVDLYWYDTIQAVTQTDILPIINLLDENSYLPTTRF
jgi:hypothetical protein